MKMQRLIKYPFGEKPNSKSIRCSPPDDISVKPGSIVKNYVDNEKSIAGEIRNLKENERKFSKDHTVLANLEIDSPEIQRIMGEFKEGIENNENRVERLREIIGSNIEIAMNALYDKRMELWKKEAQREFIVPFFGKEGRVPYPFNTIFPTSCISEHTIAFLDVDYLKKINDQKGHIYADMVLRQIYKTINLVAKEYDGMAFRYGGDEVIVWFMCDVEKAEKAIVEMRRRIAEIEVDKYFLDYGTNRTYITLSAGLTKINGTFERTLDIADKLLYRSKDGNEDVAGRDCITINNIKIDNLTEEDMERWTPVKFKEYIDYQNLERKYAVVMKDEKPVLIDKETNEVLDILED